MKKNLILFFFLCISNINHAQISGTLDPTFGVNGRATTPISSGNDFANIIAVQADNKIIVAGRYEQKPAVGTIFFDSVYTQLVRYNQNGTLDVTFGANGRVTTTVKNSSVWAMTLQNDGKILVGGAVSSEGFMVIRYNMNGSLDSTFNNRGILKTFYGVSNNVDYVSAITVQSDGKILITGGTRPPTGMNGSLAVLARLNTDGSFDASFGSQGRAFKQIDAAKSIDIRSIALQNDNKILLCGYQFVNVLGNITRREMVVFRYNSNGIIDSSFANNGIYIMPNHDAFSIKALNNGKIVVGGSVDIDTTAKTKAFALFQFNANGSLDNAFGTNGKVVTEATNNCFATDMIVQKDNKILLAGAGRNSINNSDFVMVRYNANGSLDNSFGIAGQSTIVAADYWLDYFRMTLQNDGKIVVSHTYNRFNKYNFVVSRYNNNIVGVGINKVEEKSISLSIYPNPTTSMSILEYELIEDSPVKILVNNELGIMVKNIINENQQAGYHQHKIDVSDLNTGVYFLQIVSDKQTLTRKILIQH